MIMNEKQQRAYEVLEMLQLIKKQVDMIDYGNKITLVRDCKPDSLQFVLSEAMYVITLYSGIYKGAD